LEPNGFKRNVSELDQFVFIKTVITTIIDSHEDSICVWIGHNFDFSMINDTLCGPSRVRINDSATLLDVHMSVPKSFLTVAHNDLIRTIFKNQPVSTVELRITAIKINTVVSP